MRTLIFTLLAASLCWAQTGEIILTGTQQNAGAGPAANYGVAQAFDGNFTTAFASTAGNTYVGVDAGKAVQLRRVYLAPRPGDGYQSWGATWVGSTIEGSNTALNTTTTVLYTVPAIASGTQFVPWQFTEVPLSVATYRYLAVHDPNAYGDVAELRFSVDATTGVSAMPVMPVISPGSGSYLSGTVTVTMTSRTTSATMHYTVDGTTPTCSSTTYSGSAPITLNATAPVVVKAVACDATLTTQISDVTMQSYKGYGWRTGDVEYDDAGRPMHAHAGSVFFAEGYWWRTGMVLAYGNQYNTNVALDPGNYIYKSKDLLTWTYVGLVPAFGGLAHYDRSHVLYNSSTLKYVLWVNCGDDYGYMHACIASADHPQGPWTSVTTMGDPGTLGYKDNNLFRDDNGDAYCVFTDGTQTNIYVMKLAADYLSATGSATMVVAGGGNEGPIMWRHGSTYFIGYSAICSFACTTPSPQYKTATTPLGAWSSAASLYSTSADGTAYRGQPTNVVRIPYLRDAYLYLGDVWIPAVTTNPAGSTWYDFMGSYPLWLPMSHPTSTSVSIPVLGAAPVPFGLNYWSGGLFPMPGVVQVK